MKIIFGAYTEDSVLPLLPLFAALPAEKITGYFIPGYTEVFSRRSIRGVELLAPPELSTVKWKDSKRNALRVMSTILIPEGAAYLDKLMDLHPSLCGLARRIAAWTKIYPEFIRRQLSEIKPELVVLPMTEICGEIIAKECAPLGIPVCYLLTHHSEIRMDEHRSCGLDLRSTYIVSGEYGRRRVIQKGIDSTNIRVCGSPFFEKTIAFKATHSQKKEPCGRLLFVLSGGQELEHRYVFELLEEYISTRQGASLLIRDHPYCRRDLELRKRNSVHSSRIDLHDCSKPIEEAILSSDAVVVLNSAAMLESIVLDTPTLYWHTGFLPAPFAPGTNGDVLLVRSRNELFTGLDKMLFNCEPRRKWIQSHAGSSEKYIAGEGAIRKILKAFDHIVKNRSETTPPLTQPLVTNMETGKSLGPTDGFSHSQKGKAVTLADSISKLGSFDGEEFIVSFNHELTSRLEESGFRRFKDVQSYSARSFSDFDQLYRHYTGRAEKLFRQCKAGSRQRWLQHLLLDGVLLHFCPLFLIGDLLDEIIPVENPSQFRLAVENAELGAALSHLLLQKSL